MTETMVVLVTAPAGEVAATLARALVQERLVACVNIVAGVRSVYRWQGEVCDDAEDLLVLKTRRANLPQLDARLHELHPYDTPELLALPVEYGAHAYLAWVDQAATVGERG